MAFSTFRSSYQSDTVRNTKDDLKTEKEAGDQVSLASGLTGSTIPPPPYQTLESLDGFKNPIPEVPIKPSKVFTVHAYGTHFIRFPTPSPELEVAIFNGTDTSVEPVYVSSRSKRSSGNAILRHAVKGDLLATTYKFGPFREPEIRRLNAGFDRKLIKDEGSDDLAVRVSTGCRAINFDSIHDKSVSFKWEYKRAMTTSGKKKLIILSMHDKTSSTTSKKYQMLAALVRTDDTRTPGTKRSDAGNGGLLVIDVLAAAYLDEEMVVGSCLMMLKKEIDRQRMVQIAIMTGGGGGGG